MMLYLVLGVLFTTVFVFIIWRILIMNGASPRSQEAYICPHCNEYHCDCQKRGDNPRS